MTRTAYLWPIERVDGAGEPSPAGEYLKIGFRHGGEVKAVSIDILDAEAFVAGVRTLIAGQRVPSAWTQEHACEVCSRGVGPGELAYQSKPGGRRCLICEACAPTVAEEDAAVLKAVQAGVLPDGFRSRAEAISWRAGVRMAFSLQVKRLSPLAPPPVADPALAFPEPPATAKPIVDDYDPEYGENSRGECD